VGAHSTPVTILSKNHILIYYPDIKTSFNMHLLLLITTSLASLAPFASAFTLPEGLTNGIYAAYYNATGHEVHVRASDLTRLSAKTFARPNHAIRSNRLEKRQDAGSEIYCGCGFNMNHGDCDNAVAMLKSQFPAFVNGGVNFYSISNSVVVSLYLKRRWKSSTLTKLTIIGIRL
jgi:hypothetical protein